MIRGFRFTHVKRSSGDLVGVLDIFGGRVTYAYASEEQTYSLKADDFCRRFRSL